MIFEKRKNSDKARFPFLTAALLLIIVGVFAVYQARQSESNGDTISDAQPAAVNIDISGEWVGTGTEDYGVESRYYMRLALVQEGSEIYGMQYLTTSNYEPEIYAISTVSGTFDGETFTFTEGEVVTLENITMDRWCLASASLSFENIGGQDTLVGTWASGEPERTECGGITGRVILSREPVDN